MTLDSVLGALTILVGLVTPPAAAVWLYYQARRARRDVKEDSEESRVATLTGEVTEARIALARAEERIVAQLAQITSAQAMVVDLTNERDHFRDLAEQRRDDLYVCRGELALCRAGQPLPPSAP